MRNTFFWEKFSITTTCFFLQGRGFFLSYSTIIKMKTKLLTTTFCLLTTATALAAYSSESRSKDSLYLIFPKAGDAKQQAASENRSGEESCAGRYFYLTRSLACTSDTAAVSEKYSPSSGFGFGDSTPDNGYSAGNISANRSGMQDSYSSGMRMLFFLQAVILISAAFVGALKMVA
jgi:hypothetical protein